MYVLSIGNQAVVIDPCCPWEETGLPMDLSVTSIFCTHGHFDHIAEADHLVSLFSCPLYISEEDKKLLPSPELNRSSTFGLDISVRTSPITWPQTIMKPQDLGFSDNEPFTLSIIPTPGHTMGSVCFLFDFGDQVGKHMFTGDMLFAGSIGRTDLGGSDALMKQSLFHLKQLDDTILCYPGHGNKTYLGKEKLYNPYFFI